MNCSKARFPSLTVAVGPRLRDQIEGRESLNGKVAFSIRCELNNTVKYMNRSAVVSESLVVAKEYHRDSRVFRFRSSCLSCFLLFCCSCLCSFVVGNMFRAMNVKMKRVRVGVMVTL